MHTQGAQVPKCVHLQPKCTHRVLGAPLISNNSNEVVTQTKAANPLFLGPTHSTTIHMETIS